MSKGKERNGSRKGKLKSDFIEWTERRGKERGGEVKRGGDQLDEARR